MPATYIAAAGIDVVHEQAEAFSERLRASDVDPDTRRFPKSGAQQVDQRNEGSMNAAHLTDVPPYEWSVS
jgi:acetyl esterase/lipase